MKAALLTGMLALTVSSGCAVNDVSLSITEMLAVTRVNMCVAMAVGMQVTRNRGLLDLSFVSVAGYIATPLVRNNLPSHLVGPTPGIEFNSVQVTGANVTITLPPGPNIPPVAASDRDFFYPSAAGRIDPNGGLASMFVEVVPARVAKALRGSIPHNGLLTLDTQIVPVGVKSGDTVFGGPIEFAVDLCDGCLIAPPPPPCPFPLGTMVAPAGCFPQQDDPAQCCVSGTEQLLCGSAAPIATK